MTILTVEREVLSRGADIVLIIHVSRDDSSQTLLMSMTRLAGLRDRAPRLQSRFYSHLSQAQRDARALVDLLHQRGFDRVGPSKSVSAPFASLDLEGLLTRAEREAGVPAQIEILVRGGRLSKFAPRPAPVEVDPFAEFVEQEKALFYADDPEWGQF